MKSLFGWYYEGGSVQGTGRDYWDVVERALVDALARGGHDARLRVGEMKRSRPSDLIDEDDVRDVLKEKEGVSAAVSLAMLVHERYGERVEEGQARFTSLRGAANSFAELLAHQGSEDFAQQVLAWADEHLSLDPEEWCDGAPVGNIVWIAGKWRCQGELTEAERAAVKATVTQDPRGDTWGWTALHHACGRTTTLKEAMENAGSVLQGWEPSDGEFVCDERDGMEVLQAIHDRSGWSDLRSSEAILFGLDREEIDGTCVCCGVDGLETVNAGRGRWCWTCVTARDEARAKMNPGKNENRPGVCVTTVEITEWPR